jgi:hypothetical protein
MCAMALSSERYRHSLIATCLSPGARSPLQRLLYPGTFERWVRTIYLAERDPDRREALKDIALTGAPSAAIATRYNEAPLDRTERVGRMTVEDAYPWYGAFDRHLENAAPDTVAVCVGIGSGKETRHFAERFPHIKFIATEIDRTILSVAANAHPLPNVRYEVARVQDLMTVLPENVPVTVFASATFEYVQPEHLLAFFQRIRQRGNATIILGEPWRADGAALAGTASRWRANFGCTHDYAGLAERAGLDIIECCTIFPFEPADRHHAGLGHVFAVLGTSAHELLDLQLRSDHAAVHAGACHAVKRNGPGGTSGVHLECRRARAASQLPSFNRDHDRCG